MKKKIIGLVLISSVGLLVSPILSQKASALTSSTSVTVIPGPLTLVSASDVNYGQITLNGRNQIKVENSTLRFNDFRGRSNEGWEVTVKRNSEVDNKGIILRMRGTGINQESNRVTLANKFELSTDAERLVSLSGPVTQPNEFEVAIENELQVQRNAISGESQTVLTWDLRAQP